MDIGQYRGTPNACGRLLSKMQSCPFQLKWRKERYVVCVYDTILAV